MTTAIAYEFADVTITNDSFVSEVGGSVFFGPAGTTDPNAGWKFHKGFFPAGTVLAFRGPGSILIEDAYSEGFAEKPVTGNWSIADSATATKATVTIVSIPALHGGTLVSVQWTKDGGTTWNTMTRKTAGTEDITLGAAATYNVQLRFVTLRGAGIASAVKTVTVA